MSDYTEQEIERLHVKLANIYRRGLLTSAEKLETRGLWARIERLETANVAQVTREARRREAMAAAEQEGQA